MHLQNNLTAPRIVALPATEKEPKRGINLGPKSKLPIDAKLLEELKKNKTFMGWVSAGDVSILNPVN